MKQCLAIAVCLVAAAAGSTLPCICTMEYAPVCGVDGQTYGNKCSLDCDGVEKLSDGECPKAMSTVTKVCPCPRIFTPVCGKDGVTYGNTCEMECQGVELLNSGICIATQANDELPLCICTFIYLPVCGSDGVSYGNKCSLDCASRSDTSITKVSEGECPTTKAPIL